MPDVLIFNDSASFASSDTFSTQDSIEQPRHTLRRRSTVSQIARRVSKRISQTILSAGVQGHALSEKNLKDLNDATGIDPHNLRSPIHQPHETKMYSHIHENNEEEYPVLSLEEARDTRVRQSYATFCENFTLSETTSTRRRFDLSMGTEWEEHTEPSHTDPTLENNDTPAFSGSHACPKHITVHSNPSPSTVAFPRLRSSTGLDGTLVSYPGTAAERSSEWPVTEAPKVEEDLNRTSSCPEITPNSKYPGPPPYIITPTVWMDMQRHKQERKASRRQKLLNPFRSWFITSQPSLGRRHEVVE